MSLILIIEDNDKNLKLVRDVLQVKGYATIEAGTAEDGVELARERKPDLILMDIQLPGMSGIEALKVLRADATTATIPAIAVTASVMQQDRRLITEAGFDGYVGKPINIKEFLDAVRSTLEERQPRAPQERPKARVAPLRGQRSGVSRERGVNERRGAVPERGIPSGGNEAASAASVGVNERRRAVPKARNCSPPGVAKRRQPRA